MMLCVACRRSTYLEELVTRVGRTRVVVWWEGGREGGREGGKRMKGQEEDFCPLRVKGIKGRKEGGRGGGREGGTLLTAPWMPV
jgi:hypothetical protein